MALSTSHTRLCDDGRLCPDDIDGRVGVPFAPALIIAAIVVALASVPVERLLYRRFYGGEELDQVLLTMGLFHVGGGRDLFWDRSSSRCATAGVERPDRVRRS